MHVIIIIIIKIKIPKTFTIKIFTFVYNYTSSYSIDIIPYGTIRYKREKYHCYCYNKTLQHNYNYI